MNSATLIVLDIFKEVIFSRKEETIIAQRFEKIELKKGAVLLKKNQSVLHQYYVYTGCLRTFYLDINGKKHTLQFAICN